MHLKINIQGDTIPRAIQVSTQPTQFISVPRFKEAGESNLYSCPLSCIVVQTVISIPQGKAKIKRPKIISAAVSFGCIKFVSPELDSDVQVS